MTDDSNPPDPEAAHDASPASSDDDTPVESPSIAVSAPDDRPPTEPRPSDWILPPADAADEIGFVAAGADLKPGTLLAAYRSGLFPMPLRRRSIGWWSPDPRGILPLDGLHATRSMRRSARRYTTSRNRCFEQVIRQCGAQRRDDTWITDAIVAAYTTLHELGWAHSIETWRGEELVGGLYGVRIGGLFAGESMFHTATDASKVAVMALVDWLRADGATLLDVQWATPHLRSLGVVEVPRAEYLRLLADATAA